MFPKLFRRLFDLDAEDPFLVREDVLPPIGVNQLGYANIWEAADTREVPPTNNLILAKDFNNFSKAFVLYKPFAYAYVQSDGTLLHSDNVASVSFSPPGSYTAIISTLSTVNWWQWVKSPIFLVGIDQEQCRVGVKENSTVPVGTYSVTFSTIGIPNSGVQAAPFWFMCYGSDI